MSQESRTGEARLLQTRQLAIVIAISVGTLLVEVAELLRQVHGLPGTNVFQINDGVCDATLRADDEAFKIRSLFGVWIANLGVFGNGEFRRARDRPGPLYRARDRASVGDANDFVFLSKGRRRSGKKESHEQVVRIDTAHTPPLNARASAPQPMHSRAASRVAVSTTARLTKKFWATRQPNWPRPLFSSRFTLTTDSKFWRPPAKPG